MVGIREALRRILQLEDDPELIARGAVIGLFIAMTPPVVPQTLIAFCLAWVFGANRMAALLMTFITNPLTGPILYGVNYCTGAWFLERICGWNAPPWSDVWSRLADSSGFFDFFSRFYRIGWWVVSALAVGGFMVSLVFAPAVYVGIRRWVEARRRRREGSREP